MFASAFCMIVDTIDREVAFASTGRPLPVSETPNRDREELGEVRLCQSLRRRINLRVARLCRSVCEDVNQWLDGLPSPDDICLVGVEIGPAVGSSPSQLDTTIVEKMEWEMQKEQFVA